MAVTETDEFDSEYLTEAERARVRARASLIAAGEATGADLGWAKRAAADLGVSEELVLAAPRDVALEIAARKMARSRKLTDWAASDPERARKALDTTSMWESLQFLFERLGKSQWREEKLAELERLGWEGVANKVGELGVGIAEGYWEFLADTGKSFWNGTLDLPINMMASLRSIGEAGNFGDAEERDNWRIFAEKLGQGEEFLEEKKGKVGERRGLSGFWMDVMNQIPQLGGSVAGFMTSPALGMSFMGSQIYGSSYRELTEMGIDPTNASVGASINASLQMPLELLGVTKMARLLRGTDLRSLANLKRAMFAAGTIEGVTEFAQKWPEYAGHTWAESSLYAKDFGERFEWFAGAITDGERFARAFKEGLYEGALGFVMGAGGGAAGHFIHRKKFQAAAEEEQRIQDLARDLTEQSMAAQEMGRAMEEARATLGTEADPEASYEIIDKLIPDGYRKLFIDADDLATLFHEEVTAPQEVLDALGVTAAEVNEALNGGAPLEVEAARVLSANNSRSGKVLDLLRLTPGGPTAGQSRDFHPDEVISEAMAVLLGEEDMANLPLGERRAEQARDLARWKEMTQRANAAMAEAKKQMREAGLSGYEIETNSALMLAHAMAFYKTYGYAPDRLIRNRYQVRGWTDSGEEIDDKLREILGHDDGIGDERGRTDSRGQEGEQEGEQAGEEAEEAPGIEEAERAAAEAQARDEAELNGEESEENDLAEEEAEGGAENIENEEQGEESGGNTGESLEEEIARAWEEELRAQEEAGGVNELPPDIRDILDSNPDLDLSDILNFDPDAETEAEQGAEEGSEQGAEQGAEQNAEQGSEPGHGRPWTREEWDRWVVDHPDPDAEFGPDSQLARETAKEFARRMAEKYPAGHPYHYRNEMDEPFEEIMDRLSGRVPYEGPTIRTKPGRVRRGSIVMDGWKSVINLFRNRNIYTMQHEASHIYIDDLLRVASDDGSIAAANIMREFRRATTTKEGFDRRAFADFAKAMAATRGTWQERFLAFKSAIEAQIDQLGDEKTEALAQLAQWKETAEAREASPTQATRAEETAAYAREQVDLYEKKTARLSRRLLFLNRAGRAAERALKHYDAIMEAREDVRLLASRAGIGDARLEAITRRSGKVVYRGNSPTIADNFATDGEAYERLQEWLAQNFQAYIMEGRAPSRKLQGVFRRFAKWLVNLYGSVRYWLGRDGVDPEVRGVFDRLLASRDQIAQISALETTAEMEAAFLDNDQFTEAERNELKAMLEQARLIAQSVLERAKLDQLEKFRRKALRRAKKEIAAESFWKVVASAHINEADARRILGDKATNELIQVSGRLIEGGADPAIVVQAKSGDLWADPDAMLRDLHERLVVRGETIDNLAEKKIEGELDEFSRNIAEKIANEQGDAYEKYLEAVDETLWRLVYRRKFGREPEEADRKARTLITSYQSIRAEAAQRLAHVPLGEISFARYQSMHDKALRDREKAFRKGDLQAVMDAVRRARLAAALMNEAREIRRVGDRLRDLAGRTARLKRGQYSAYHTAALDILLRNLGLGKMRGEMDASLESQSVGWLLTRIMGEETDDINGLVPAFGQNLMDLRLPSTDTQAGMFYELDMEGLLEAHNLLEWLRKDGAETGRQSRKLREDRAFACADACREAMAKLPDAEVLAPGTVRYRARRAIDRLYANTDALRWQTDKGDGLIRLPGKTGKSMDGGPLSRLFDKITDGENAARLDREEIGKRLAGPVNALAKSIARLQKAHGKLLRGQDGNIIPLPEQIRDAYSTEGWTGDRLIAFALNCGNVQNMNRLMTGYTRLREDGKREFTLTYDMVAELLGDTVATQVWNAAHVNTRNAPAAPPSQGRNGLLTRDDWLAIQEIWDVLASRWGDLSRAHLELYGFAPERVKIDGVRVTGFGGERIQLKGGYYPLRYDGNISSRVGQWNEMDDLLNRNDALFQKDTTARKGMTEKRTKQSPRLPVKFDTSILSEHINDVITFIRLARPVRDYNDVIRRPEFKKTYITKFGRDDYEAIASNLRGVLRREPGVANSDMLTSLANTLRPYLVYWGLSWNLKVAALQSTAVFPAMGDLGVQPMVKSIMWMSKNGPSALKQIHEVSPYMKSRLHNLDQDLRRAIDQLSFKKKASVTIGEHEISWDDFVQLGMSPIIIVDAAATGAVWAAAYNVKMAEAKLPSLAGRDRKNLFKVRDQIHEEAVKFADNMVKASNPDYDGSSRSAFLRVNNAARLVNGFASAITLFAQRGRQMSIARKKGLVSFPEYARFFMYEYVAPAVFFGLAISLARGVYPWDEPEEFTSNMLSSLMDFYTMRIPIFGSTAGDLALDLFDIKHQGFRQGGPRTTIDQPYQLAGNFVSKARKVIQGEDAYTDLALATADIFSFASRFPLSKLVRNASKGIEQYEEGRGTILSPLSPRPGKTPSREREILYGIFD